MEQLEEDLNCQLELKAPTLVKLNMEPEEIMFRLNKTRLRRLQKYWRRNNGALDLKQFVRVMLDEVPCEEFEKVELLHGAISIFHEIDINGDGTVDWDEFV